MCVDGVKADEKSTTTNYMQLGEINVIRGLLLCIKILRF